MLYTQSQLRCLQGMGLVPWVKRGSANPVQSDHAQSEYVQSGHVPTDHVQSLVQQGVNQQNDTGEAAVAQLVQEVAASQATLQTQQTATIESVERPMPSSSVADLMQTPLVEIPFRGQRCTQLGKSDAPLLILVEAISTRQKQYPFESSDAKLFDDMLRSIAWRRQDVCLAVLPPADNSLLLEEAGSSTSDHSDNACVADLCKPHRDAVLLFRMSLPDTLNSDELLVPMERKGMMAWQLPHPAKLRESPNRKRQAWNVLKAARLRLHPGG